jgi:hypothetical protein
MTRPLFPLTKCSLSSIPEVDFEFNSVCRVLPAPPPIFDQPDIEIPLDFPPQPVILPPIRTPAICMPCPQLHAVATMGFAQDSEAGAFATVTPLTSAGSCDSSPDCQFEFDFDFRFPCADIDATATMHFLAGSSESQAPVPVIVTKNPPVLPGGVCRYHFDFDFETILASSTFLTQLVTTIINENITTVPCLPQLVFFTLGSGLASGGSAGATSPTDGAITVLDSNSFIPSGKSVPSGAAGWAWRTCFGGGFIYELVTANKCPQ